MDQHNDVFDDLVTLRKGPGLTIGRLLRAGALVAALGGPDQPPDTLKQRLIAAIDSLDDLGDKEALRAALGLHPATAGEETLLGRRRVYGRVVGRSPDTLLDWETRAMTTLSLRLLTSFYAGAPIDRLLPIPHGGFLQGELVVRTLIKDRHFVEHEQRRTVVSLVEGAKGFQYNSDVETELEPLEGVEGQTEYVNGGSVHRLFFRPGPLGRGDVHRFGFIERRRHPTPVDDAVPNLDKAGQSFETPTLRYRQRVVFEGDVPSTLWSYNNLSRLERPGSPSGTHQQVLDRSARVQQTFSQLYGGLYAGIAWFWEAPDPTTSTDRASSTPRDT